MESKSQKSEKKYTSGKVIMFLVLAFYTAFFLYGNYDKFWHSYINKTQFASTTGRLTQYGPFTSKRFPYVINYRVNGVGYICSDANGCNSISESGTVVGEKLDAAERDENKSIQVFYNPTNPRQSYLIVTKQPVMAKGFWFGVFVLLIALCVLRSLLMDVLRGEDPQ